MSVRREGSDTAESTAGRRNNERESHLRQPLRRASDVRTPKERLVFLRDKSYSKNRPLHNLPWLQLKKKTYLDDAEKLYGRKESWAALAAQSATDVGPSSTQNANVDPQVLESILLDAIKDLTEQARVEGKRARWLRSMCEQRQKEYVSYMSVAATSPSVLRTWGHQLKREEEQRRQKGQDASDPVAQSRDGDAEASGTARKLSEDEELAALERKARGEDALLEGSLAMQGIDSNQKLPEFSAFPFLRQRAVGSGKATLDPSLVDWSAKYFPDDDATTFEEPVVPLGRQANQQTTPPSDTDVARSSAAAESSEDRSGQRHKAKREKREPAHRRLHKSLKGFMRNRRNTFDGEGLFFPVRRVRDGDEHRAAKPTRPVNPDELLFSKSPTVKVDWNTVATARKLTKTPEVHRAKERLIRLTRGEDADGIL